MIGLVCTDVDGTLVGASGAVHPEVWRAVERARAAGIRVALCSGRPGFGITRVFAEHVDPEGWHSFQNGASVVDLATGRSRSAQLSGETVAMLVARARATGRLLELYTDHDYAVEPYSASAEARARRHAGLLGVPFEARAYASLTAPIVRAQWLVPIEDGDAVAAEPHPRLEVSPSTAPTMPDTMFVNLTPAGIDKGAAVRLIAEEYGVPLDEVMYVGDGWNDASALRVVGYPVAMANAEPEIRAAARYTVAHVDANGLAEALDLAIAA